MNLYILATASKVGGALSIYLQFLDHLEKERGEDQYYILIDSQMPIKKMDGVEYITIKTTGLGRISFDIFGFRKLIKERGIKPDAIFSLQNTAVRISRIPQLVYYHQSLPFFKCKYSLLSSAGRTYFFYHYMYPLYVRLLHRKGVNYIVQTSYMKECFSKRFSFVPCNNVCSYFPDVENVESNEVSDYVFDEGTYNFIYPALAADYKEHETLVYALMNLKDKDVRDKIRIHLTFTENSYPHLSNLISNLHLEKNFVFHGRIDHEILLSMVKSSHGLLFPSVIETIGLPMLEAAAMGVPVVSNDLPFVHSLCHQKEHFPELKMNGSSWPQIFQLITTLGKKETKN